MNKSQEFLALCEAKNKPTVASMSAAWANHNFDYDEFKFGATVCDACGKSKPSRKCYTADDGGEKIFGYVCDDCLAKVFAKYHK